MFSRRLSASLVALPLAVSLAACGSSGDGAGKSSGAPSVSSASPSTQSVTSSSPSTSTSSSSSAAASSGSGDNASVDAAQLLASLRSANASITSATFKIETVLDGTSITGTGKQKISNGKATAFDITQKLPGGAGDQRILLVGGKAYIKQAGISKNPAKPYVLVTASSSNPLIRQLASSLASAQSSASINAAVGLLTAARSVKSEGSATVAGQQTTHYKVVVDPSKLPASNPSSVALKKAGLTSLPIDIYLDDKGRTVQTVTKVTVQGKTVSSTFLVTGYNVPVTISAPPASQVTTG